MESFDGKFREELVNREILQTLREAQILIERWLPEYNKFRPHGCPRYRSAAPTAIQPVSLEWVALHQSTCVLALP